MPPLTALSLSACLQEQAVIAIEINRSLSQMPPAEALRTGQALENIRTHHGIPHWGPIEVKTPVPGPSPTTRSSNAATSIFRGILRPLSVKINPAVRRMVQSPATTPWS